MAADCQGTSSSKASSLQPRTSSRVLPVGLTSHSSMWLNTVVMTVLFSMEPCLNGPSDPCWRTCHQGLLKFYMDSQVWKTRERVGKEFILEL